MVGLAACVLALGALAGIHAESLGTTVFFRQLNSESHERQATIIFGGDMMFDRTIRTYADRFGGSYLFACLDPLFSKADLVVANLEGPITDNVSTSQYSEPGDGNNYTFTFPTTSADLLFRHNIRLVSLGNNHIMNFSRDGLLQTETLLDAAQVRHFGDPDKGEADRVARLEVGGIPFSFVNWSDWTSDKTDHTVAQVRAEKATGRTVIVYAHWGEEYVPAPDRVRRLAHSFVDAGASLIIGSHPHIVQEMELYRGVRIYYSLGNLIFDQYWNDAVSHGLLVQAVFGADSVPAITEIPVVLQRNRQTCPLLQE
jgi:poly-gamma-glutamate synthesis protein (capsule biosynthesis protein)